MKVSELEGAALDYWVARSEGKNHAENPEWGNALTCGGAAQDRCVIAHRNWGSSRYFEPSKSWKDGGPIIEREEGEIQRSRHFDVTADGAYWASMGDGITRFCARGPTHLVAAMRAYVGSRFGGEVPDEGK